MARQAAAQLAHKARQAMKVKPTMFQERRSQSGGTVLKLSQGEFAALFGTDQQQISNAERGKTAEGKMRCGALHLPLEGVTGAKL
jgi:DNA-binding transcriptional regulator YiaG